MNVDPCELNLICLPCAGASATIYQSWRHGLSDWINVLPIELPGRGLRVGEPFVKDFRMLVSQLCDEIAGVAHGYWAIFGHDVGALLAFGIASRMQSIQQPLPTVLLLSGSPAPSRQNPDGICNTNDNIAVLAGLKKMGGTPQQVFASVDLLRCTLDALRADYRVGKSFHYLSGGRLTIPIRVFAGREDNIEPDRIEAWCKETGGSFNLYWFDGGHFFIHEHKTQLLQIVEQNLSQLHKDHRGVSSISI